MAIEQLIESGALRLFKGGVIDDNTDISLPLVVLNAKRTQIEVTAQQPVRLVVAYTSSSQSSVDISLAAGSVVELVELYMADSFANVTVNQAEGSQCRTFMALLSSSNTTYTYNLNGCNAESTFNGLFIATGSDHATLNLTTRHLVSDCKSNSLIKGISADRATGEFRGLVYVAPDAQRTDAQQQNRNIELDNSHIVALPQLEIYADDVRCSHGSTVGYSDAEAIFYMRQRGISEADARRLQIEGFVQDVASRGSVEPICCLVREAITDKLSKI